MNNDIKIESGKRRQFSTGAERQSSEGKGTPVLVPGDAIIDIAKLFEKGASVYGARNWEKGLPLSEILNSLERHLQAEKMGRTDENHARALAWNAMIYLATKLRVKEGILPQELDDVPNYGKDAAVTEKPINTHRSGWSRNCTKESCNDTAMFYCSILKRSLCRNHYFSKPPQFKKGDKVRIDLRAEASDEAHKNCAAANYKGVYEAKDDENKSPYNHVVCVDGENVCFYDDEITLLEDK